MDNKLTVHSRRNIIDFIKINNISFHKEWKVIFTLKGVELSKIKLFELKYKI